MGLPALDRHLTATASYGGSYGLTRSDFGPPSYWTNFNGVPSLSDDQALTITTNYACRRNIAEDTAKIPFKMLRYGKNAAGLETRTAIEGDSIAHCMTVQANPFMTGFVFRSLMEDWAVGIGDGWAEVVRDSGDVIREMYPIHPSRVNARQAKKKANGFYTFKIWNDNGTTTTIDEEDMFHLYGYSQDGRFGIPIVQMMMNSLGLTSAIELFLKKFYENSARPSCVLTTDETLSISARDALRKQWAEAYGGPVNAGKTVVMDNGMKITDFKSDFKAMELTDLKKLQKNDIAMAYRMPMNKLQDIEQAQGWSTLDALESNYVNDCLMPWLVRFEQETHRQLMKPYGEFAGYGPDIQAHIETKGLLRGDVKTRMEYLRARFAMATITPNEVRELEDENPSDDTSANKLFIQGAFVPLDMAGKIQMQQAQSSGQSGDNQSTAEKERVESFAKASRLGKLTNGTGTLNGNH